MNTTLAAFCFLALGCAAAPSAGNAEGSELYLDNCSACHGENAEGNIDLLAPVLAGYSSEYLSRQTVHFMAGTRTGEDEMGMIEGMVDIQKDLSAEELDQISGYLESLDIPVLEQESEPTGFGARGLFSQCGSCHEANAAGNDALNAPRLTGQYGWYLKSQLVGFREGHRGTHEDDKYGRQMKTMADAIISEEDMDTLVNYILKLGSE